MAMLIETIDPNEALKRSWRIFGWLLVVAALAFLVFDLVEWKLYGGPFAATPAAWLWYTLHKESLQMLQAAIERHVWPPLWDGLELMLTWPVFVVFGAPGLAILYFAYLRRGRRRRR